jgi:O-antigen ligase
MKKRESGMKLLFWSLLAGLTAFLSNSRYVSFGFIIIMMQILFDSYYVKLKKVTLVLVFILPVSIFFILQFIGYDLNDYLANRLFSKDSDSSRIISFFLFLKYFPEAPFWGTGVRASYSLWRELGNSDTLMQIHIGFLSHLYEFGAVGSLLLFTIYFLIIRKFSNTRKLTGYSGSLFAFIMFLFANLTMVEYSVFFYGLMLSMVFDRYFFQKSLVTS